MTVKEQIEKRYNELYDPNKVKQIEKEVERMLKDTELQTKLETKAKCDNSKCKTPDALHSVLYYDGDGFELNWDDWCYDCAKKYHIWDIVGCYEAELSMSIVEEATDKLLKPIQEVIEDLEGIGFVCDLTHPKLEKTYHHLDDIMWAIRALEGEQFEWLLDIKVSVSWVHEKGKK